MLVEDIDAIHRRVLDTSLLEREVDDRQWDTEVRVIGTGVAIASWQCH